MVQGQLKKMAFSLTDPLNPWATVAKMASIAVVGLPKYTNEQITL
jgi:hypothetical protein